MFVRPLVHRLYALIVSALFFSPLFSFGTVTVYLLDNGVREDHHAFDDIDISTIDLLDDGNIPFGDHATHMAGLVLRNSTEIKLISLRVMNEEGEGKWSELLKGIHWIRNHHEVGTPAVVNLSLGGIAGDPRIEIIVNRAINELAELGIAIVVAGGNDGSDTPRRIPSTLDCVISVGAVSAFGNRLDWSNYGNCVDLYVKGENLEGPGSFSNVHRIRDSGTSVAGAVVAGYVATYLESVPSASPGQIKDWLISSSSRGVVGNIPDEWKEGSFLFNGEVLRRL